MIEYFIEVPGTNIKESVDGFMYDTLYDMAQQYGIAELAVSYTHLTLPTKQMV